MSIREILLKAVENYKITLSKTQLEQFEVYFDLLTEWNKKINLTAITDEEGVAVKHFADCLEVFNYVDFPNNSKIIDVGTGAGFPGVVMKIARPDLEVTLLDSLQKRLVFLRTVLEKTGHQALVVHSRGEDGAHLPRFREQYDFAVSRAVARLNILAEYTLGYVKPGGRLIAFKGPAADEEIETSKYALSLLKAETEKRFEYALPITNERRSILIIKKTGALEEKYPRSSGKIKSKPL